MAILQHFIQKNNEEQRALGNWCSFFIYGEGEAGHQDSIVRTEYSVNTLIENGVELEKLGYAIANWNRA